MAANRQLVAAIRGVLEQLADPERAPQMQAYLKSELPCLGVTIPLQRKLVARAAAKFPIESFDEWRDTVRELWNSADTARS